jgi:AcrR family transcriptional regulator
MSHPGQPVKPPRRYDASRRRDQARRRRDRITDAAQRLFLRDGYGPTTVAAIAAQCGVSADMIYKSFGGKPGLVRAIHQRALQGQGPVPAETRSDAIQAQQRDPRKIIQAWGAFTTEIAPRAAPILLLVRAAASTDAEMRSLLAELDGQRLQRMTGNARRLHDAGHLRPGVTLAHAADVLWTYSSPELYELLVLRRGMPLEEYGRFVANAMIDALLPSEPPDTRPCTPSTTPAPSPEQARQRADPDVR